MNDDNELLDEEDDDQFPWEDVEAARQDRRLQREHPVAESQQLYATRAKPCPQCHTAASGVELVLF